ALTVPFIPADRRMELLGRLRHVSHQLESNRQQLVVGEARVLPPAARITAARNRQMALAILGTSSADTANPHDRWVFYRDSGDKIGEAFRSLSAQANAEALTARNITALPEAGQRLAAAALRTRLMDPAAPFVAVAPLAGDFHPLVADQ